MKYFGVFVAGLLIGVGLVFAILIRTQIVPQNNELTFNTPEEAIAYFERGMYLCKKDSDCDAVRNHGYCISSDSKKYKGINKNFTVYYMEQSKHRAGPLGCLRRQDENTYTASTPFCNRGMCDVK